MPDKSYIAIDLKSFYASVECAERVLDTLNDMLQSHIKEHLEVAITYFKKDEKKNG